MPDRQRITFKPGWLQRQIARSVATLDSLPSPIRASLYGPSASQRHPRRTWTPGPWVAVDGTDVTELPDHCDDGHPHVPLLTSALAVDPQPKED